jgi:hypothetical protein
VILVVSERDVDPSIEHIQRDPVLLDVCRNGHRLTIGAGLDTHIVEGQITFSEACVERAEAVQFVVTRDPDDATAFQYDGQETHSLDGVAIRIVEDFLGRTGPAS